jgi:hypothetical protein
MSWNPIWEKIYQTRVNRYPAEEVMLRQDVHGHDSIGQFPGGKVGDSLVASPRRSL